MNFLIDAQLPPALCVWLAERGHDAVHVAHIGFIAGSDAEIAQRAEDGGLGDEGRGLHHPSFA